MKSLVILTLALKFSKQKLQEHLLIFVSVNFRNHKPALFHQDLNQKIAFFGDDLIEKPIRFEFSLTFMIHDSLWIWKHGD